MGTARVAQAHHRSIMVASRGGTGAGEGACMVQGSMHSAGVLCGPPGEGACLVRGSMHGAGVRLGPPRRGGLHGAGVHALA